MTNDFESRWHFNTSVALIMELVNELQQQEPLDVDVSPVILKRVLMMLLLMLSPMTPHIAEELWEMLGIPGGISAPAMACLSRRPHSRRADRGHHSDQWTPARQDSGG